MMMHITLMKMRKFTWRSERRLYITFNKHMCISNQKHWFVRACIALCAAAEFTTELNSLLRNCGLNVLVCISHSWKHRHFITQGRGPYLLSGEWDTVKVWVGTFVWRSEPDTVLCLQNISTQCHTFCSSFVAQHLKQYLWSPWTTFLLTGELMGLLQHAVLLPCPATTTWQPVAKLKKQNASLEFQWQKQTWLHEIPFLNENVNSLKGY